ncbi:MAG: pilus assembly FimT family protein [Minisyncoccia bacterium]
MMFVLKRKKFQIRGFTFVEMMVSIGIITLLTVMVLAYNRRAETITALARSANKLVFELQRIQNQAMLVYQGNIKEEKICGWGMYFNSPTSTIAFKDFCTEDNQGEGDKKYEENEKEAIIPLVKQTEIIETNIQSVVFVPPEPKVYFYPQEISQGVIKIRLENQLTEYPYYEIIIGKNGQIFKKLGSQP